MKTLLKGLLAATLFTAAATPALAQSTPAVKAEPAFYVSALAGRSLPNDISIEGGPVTDDLALADGWSGAIAVGWRAMENVRLELEYGYRSSEGEKLKLLNLRTDGDVKVQTLMLNAVADLKVEPWLIPYAGFGVGLARTEFSDVGTRFLRLDGEDDVFAWQFIGGIAFPVADQIQLFVDTRYLRSSQTDFVIQPDEPASTRVQSLTVNAGVRFWF